MHGAAPTATTARKTGAVAVFADETALSLLPPVRATWAPQGRTPVVRVRQRKRPKTSLVGWCCYPPTGPPRFPYRLVPGSVTDRELIRQLPGIHWTLNRPIILDWDLRRDGDYSFSAPLLPDGRDELA